MKKFQVPVQQINVFTGFVDYIVGVLYKYLLDHNNINLFSTDEYKSFYYIKENVNADIQYFYNLILETDSMGFIPVKRNIRISSEALLDLYNMVHVNKYKTVLQYMDDHNHNKYSETLKPYIYKGNFTIISKLKIAKAHNFGSELDFLEDGFLSDTNRYIHASIFIQPNTFDFTFKLNEAKKLLHTELTIYKKSLECICRKYNVTFSNWYYRMPDQTFEQIYCIVEGCINNMCYFDFPSQNQNIYMQV